MVIEYVTPVTILPVSYFKGKHLFKGLFLGSTTSPVFADVDGDGDSDLVVGLHDGTLKYYRRNASNSPILFTELTKSDNPFNGVDVGTDATPEFADINGDNKLDLVLGARDGTLRYFLNESASGSITFTPKTTASDNPFNSIDVEYNSAPIFVDIDGDSDLDLVVGEYDGNLNFFLNESTNSSIVFTPKTNTSNPFNSIDIGYKSIPRFADINKDNKLDLVLGETNGTLKYYLNESANGSISFTEKTSTEQSL